ncbi:MULTISPECIES: efflux RND transporter periplasmic adaptor subunit [unclassified Spirosoma]|uniref:efflux RND transporter periplasmic adaptor subunit n=1 Tax=unclassified Spirosoma TaxID=2621999 RepID=UPI000966D578|nr:MULTISPECIES: efflux RND transporter periplasmic adaptor subunit [unclassified Spirosoma]MBN8826864.1 efflux RND transporter periplasmic adaptor subunit [Spirosoma sp.]OJW75544.1 MAG: efflux transporter periplasmic adaptor subunit [Spirosoma sp. 48-14]
MKKYLLALVRSWFGPKPAPILISIIPVEEHPFEKSGRLPLPGYPDQLMPHQNWSLVVSASLLMFVGLSSCNSSTTSSTAVEESKVHQEKNLLATATLDTAKLENARNELNLTGKITFNQDQVVKVFPLVGGHIETLKADLGDYVKKGQTLAVIRSGDLADLEQQAVSARSQLSLAQKNMQVTEDMTKAGLSSQKDLVASKEQLEAAKGEVNRVNERRRIVGGNGSVYIVKAPVSGFIVEKTAAQGMELRSDDPENLFTISNLDHVWVLANVYESDLANVKEGDQATITTLSYPDKIFRGRIDKIFNVLDPESKTLKVRVTLDNADYRLKPEMFANVSVTYAGHDQRIAIPAKAVVFDKNRNFVVMVNKKNQPMVREVDIYKSIGPKTYLAGGLAPGDRVVTANNLLIYNALGN